MRIHLFTTDVSGLELARMLPDDAALTAVIVPENRSASEKVAALRDACRKLGVATYEHQRGKVLPADLPEADRAISWLYSQIIDSRDLARYPQGMLNMHGGKIPDYRGASVLQWQIINGERELGITWHEIVEEVDAGPIWAETAIPIADDATARELRADMIATGLALFPTAWRNAASQEFEPRRPDLDQGTVWPPRRPRDGALTSDMTARQVKDMVRALCPPWPPATVDMGGRTFAITAVSELPAADRIAYETADGETLFLDTQETEPR